MRTGEKNIILVGGFIEIIELLLSNNIHIAGIVDKSINNISDPFRERFDYLGDDEKLLLLIKEGKISKLPVLLSPDLPKVRENLFTFYKKINSKHINLISTKANVSSSSKIKENCSTIIQDFVNVSSNVVISKCVHINTFANIMHDCVLEDFVTIAPNAVLLGGVRIGKNSYIGANSTILPSIKIGKNAIIGAGAVVTRNVSAGDVVAGVPAKKIRSI